MAVMGTPLNQTFLLPWTENRDSQGGTAVGPSEVRAAALLSAGRADNPLAQLFQRLFKPRLVDFLEFLSQFRAFLRRKRPDLAETGSLFQGQRPLRDLEALYRAISVIGVDPLDDLRFQMADFEGNRPVHTDAENGAAARPAIVARRSARKGELFRRRELRQPFAHNFRPMGKNMGFMKAAPGKGCARNLQHPRADGRQAVAHGRDRAGILAHAPL